MQYVERAECSYCGETGTGVTTPSATVACRDCFENLTTCSKWKCDNRIRWDADSCYEHPTPEWPKGYDEIECPECGKRGGHGTISDTSYYCKECDAGFNPQVVGEKQLAREYEELFDGGSLDQTGTFI